MFDFCDEAIVDNVGIRSFVGGSGGGNMAADCIVLLFELIGKALLEDG